MKYYDVDLRHHEKIYLCPISDTHIGRKDIDLDLIQRYINWIKSNKCVYIWLNGDLIECMPKDAPGDLYDLELTSTDAQIEKVVSLLGPIKDRIIASTIGN